MIHTRGARAFLVALTLLDAAAPEPVNLYVSTQGKDSWSGKFPAPQLPPPPAEESAKPAPPQEPVDGPFATLDRARDEARKLKASGPVTVWIRGGIYSLEREFRLGEADSGTETAPVVYRASAKEEVRLIGGKVVKGFQPVTDPAVLNRLEEKARGRVLQADLRAQGISDFGQMSGGFGQQGGPGLELFFQDKPMTLARYPDEGFIKIVDVLGGTPVDVRGTKGCREGKFTYEGDRPSRWVGEKDAWALGYWFWDWAEQRHKIESIDPQKRAMTLAPPHHGYGYRKGQWFYGFNILAELDTPGEWYLDRQTGVLYFWPPANIEKNNAVVSVLPTLVTMRGTSHVAFHGMILEAARGTAFTMTGGTQNRISGCTFRNIGCWAVSINGGTGHSVVGCDIYGTGDGGIQLDGGDRKTLTPAGLSAENNHIHHWSRWNRMYRPAIMLNGVGNRAAHNLLENSPHMAIGFGGNDHVIEFNEIHSACYESNDAGVIYAGRNWTMRGHMIRHNYIHHIYGYEGRGCVGVYLDDMFSSATIYGNVFYQVTRPAFIGGGRDNTVENNIFVDCPSAMHVDGRALGWAHDHSDGWIREGKEKGTLSGIAYKQPPYSERYPPLVKILEENPAAPMGNVVRRNIFWQGAGEDLRRANGGAEPKPTWWDGIEAKIKPLVKLEDNLFNVNPGFVDERNLNFQLRDGSPAYKYGFKRIPIEKIGLYRDEMRASWPVKHGVRRVDAARRP